MSRFFATGDTDSESASESSEEEQKPAAPTRLMKCILVELTRLLVAVYIVCVLLYV